MDSLQEIYIEDLPTGSRSKNSSIEEFFVPAQRHPLGSTELARSPASRIVVGSYIVILVILDVSRVIK